MMVLFINGLHYDEVLSGVSDAYSQVKNEITTIWDSEDWQIKVLMIEIALVIFLIFLIFIAWKINGPAISKLLAPDSELLDSKLSNSCNSATHLHSYKRENLKKTE